MEGETDPSVKVWIHQFFQSAPDVQPLALGTVPYMSEPTVVMNMGLSGLQVRTGNFEKGMSPAYDRNSTSELLNPSLDTISTELS